MYGVIVIGVVVVVGLALWWDRRDTDRRVAREQEQERQRVVRVGPIYPYDRVSAGEILRQNARMEEIDTGRRNDAHQTVMTVQGSPSDCNHDMDFAAQVVLADMIRRNDPRMQVEFTAPERSGEPFWPLRGSGIAYQVRRRK